MSNDFLVEFDAEKNFNNCDSNYLQVKNVSIKSLFINNLVHVTISVKKKILEEIEIKTIARTGANFKDINGGMFRFIFGIPKCD